MDIDRIGREIRFVCNDIRGRNITDRMVGVKLRGWLGKLISQGGIAEEQVGKSVRDAQIREKQIRKL